MFEFIIRTTPSKRQLIKPNIHGKSVFRISTALFCTSREEKTLKKPLSIRLAGFHPPLGLVNAVPEVGASRPIRQSMAPTEIFPKAIWQNA